MAHQQTSEPDFYLTDEYPSVNSSIYRCWKVKHVKVKQSFEHSESNGSVLLRIEPPMQYREPREIEASNPPSIHFDIVIAVPLENSFSPIFYYPVGLKLLYVTAPHPELKDVFDKNDYIVLQNYSIWPSIDSIRDTSCLEVLRYPVPEKMSHKIYLYFRRLFTDR